MNRSRTSVIVRWIVGGLIALAALRVLVRVMTQPDNMINAFAGSVFGLAMLITACLFIAPEFVQWAVYPIHRALDAILLPSETLRPPVDYTLARFYHRQMRYGEACEEYFKILEYHPQEVAAYLEGIDAATAANQRAMAHKFYRMGLRKLSPKNGDRDLLIKGVSEGPAVATLDGGEEKVDRAPTSGGPP